MITMGDKKGTKTWIKKASYQFLNGTQLIGTKQGTYKPRKLF
jgi:hypothetical protein